MNGCYNVSAFIELALSGDYVIRLNNNICTYYHAVDILK